MIIKIKSLIRLIIFFSLDLVIYFQLYKDFFFVKKNKKNIKENSLLLIRLDAIGDYILFRNFIKELKTSKKYKNYKITLLGNYAWKVIAEALDSEFIEDFIWLDRDKFNNDFIYRYHKLQEIAVTGYEIVLNPVFSREFVVDNSIVKLLRANEKIGSIGDLSNILKWQKYICDKYYDSLILATTDQMFEFYRNKEFFDNLLDQKIDLQKPNIGLDSYTLNFKLPKHYAIIFIGASDEFRKWNIEGFAKVATYLKKKYGYQIVLCGAPCDIQAAIKFKTYFNGNYFDLVGKTSLVDLLYVIDNGKMMIANETSAPHVAVALDMTKIFVISNGNHFGRFIPYPLEMAPNYHAIYPPKIESNLDHYQLLCNSYGYGSNLNINDITVDNVIKKIDFFCKS